MPTYQYLCTDCGEPLEAVQSFEDDPLTTCPQCGGDLRKVFSAVGVVFKGSGFYRTDSRAKAKGGQKPGADKLAGATAPGATSNPSAERPSGGASGSAASGSSSAGSSGGSSPGSSSTGSSSSTGGGAAAG